MINAIEKYVVMASVLIAIRGILIAKGAQENGGMF